MADISRHQRRHPIGCGFSNPCVLRNEVNLGSKVQHRADVSLSEALAVTINPKEDRLPTIKATTFKDWRGNLLDQPVDAQLHSAAKNAEISKLIMDYQDRAFHKIQGLIQYALAALDRARPILLRNERNVWWGTWYFEHRMKAIELM